MEAHSCDPLLWTASELVNHIVEPEEGNKEKNDVLLSLIYYQFAYKSKNILSNNFEKKSNLCIGDVTFHKWKEWVW